MAGLEADFRAALKRRPPEYIKAILRAIRGTARRRVKADDCCYVSDGMGPDDGVEDN